MADKNKTMKYRLEKIGIALTVIAIVVGSVALITWIVKCAFNGIAPLFNLPQIGWYEAFAATILLMVIKATFKHTNKD